MKRILSGLILVLMFATTLLAWTATLDTTTPAATDYTSGGDDRMREIKVGLQERQNVDHYWPLSSNAMDNTDCGKHRWITFVDPCVPTIGASEGGLYTSDVSDLAELLWKNESGYVKQITTDNGTQACLKLELKDMVAGTGIVDDSSIEVDGTNGLQVKADGITGVMLADSVADEDTIEVSSNTLSVIHLPDAAFAGGTYTGGAGNNSTVDKIVTHGLGRTPQCIIVCGLYPTGTGGAGYGTMVWSVDGGSAYITTVGDTTFTITDYGNVSTIIYSWVAF